MTTHLYRVRGWFAALALTALTALPLGACGDDDDREATDEEYVTAICGALRGIEQRFAEIATESEDADFEDLERLFEEMFLAIAEMAGTIADELDDVTPPGDLREYHETLVEGMRLLADTMRDADSFEDLDEDSLAALESFATEEFPEAEARLDAAARNVPECEGLFDEA